jgi:hypothetical protein
MSKSDPDYSSPPPRESPEPIIPPQEDPPAAPESDAAAVPERMDTVEFERHRRTMTASPPRSRTSQIGSRRASMAGGVAGGPSIANPFFAVSLFLGVVCVFSSKSHFSLKDEFYLMIRMTVVMVYRVDIPIHGYSKMFVFC